jgi:hypothetical protein
MASGGREADETYVGRKPGSREASGWGHKEGGKMFDGIKKALSENVSPEARLTTDEARMYRKIAKAFREHLTVNHSLDEYVCGDAGTNTIEGFFSTFKRGMNGVYQHCGSQHLHRYLAEFDFRYNHRAALEINGTQRTVDALAGIGGERLTYRSAN